MTPTTRKSSDAVGKLCVGGDWACAHGDVSGLLDVARRLEDYMPEPIHDELESLVAACASDPDRAAALWDAVKNRIYGSRVNGVLNAQ
jgi:hypothetical protein